MPSAKKAGLLATERTIACAYAGCGITFTTRRSNQRFHTRACGLKARPGDSPTRGAGRRFPRVRYAERRAIFERDAWLCQLCGAPIDSELRFPHPGFGTIDHRDPDGAHDPSNWQAAHFACNVSKGRKVAPGADPKLRRAAA